MALHWSTRRLLGNMPICGGTVRKQGAFRWQYDWDLLLHGLLMHHKVLIRIMWQTVVHMQCPVTT
jgi:hypothetical protein